jgi:hypothetical protein
MAPPFRAQTASFPLFIRNSYFLDSFLFSFCLLPFTFTSVPFTYRLISRLYRLLVNPRSREPRRGVFGLLYYGIGGYVAFFVASMVLLCLEAYNLPFARDFLYARLGDPLLAVLESALF